MSQMQDAATTLVTSYCFPPYNDTAAVVAAKRVREWAEPVDVIQNAMDSIRSRDPGLVEICGSLVRRAVAVPSPTAFSSWKSIVEFQRAGLDIALRWDAEGPGYRRLYSRAQFAASHFLAASVKIRRPTIVWDAEFSDPLSHDVLGKVRESPMELDRLADELGAAIRAAGFEAPTSTNGYEWCEAAAFALADRLLFTNELQREFMLAHCADERLAELARAKSSVSPHPVLPAQYYSMAEPAYRLDPARRNIAYFGNFYANRGVGIVLGALAGIAAEDRKQIALHVFTANPDELRPLVDQRDLADCVRVNGFVDYLDFLALSRRMDCLLVNDAVTPGAGVNPFLPSKWSDYRGSGQPVWGIVEEGSSLDGQPLDYRSPVEHLTAAMQVLVRIARQPAGSPRITSR